MCNILQKKPNLIGRRKEINLLAFPSTVQYNEYSYSWYSKITTFLFVCLQKQSGFHHKSGKETAARLTDQRQNKSSRHIKTEKFYNQIKWYDRNTIININHSVTFQFTKILTEKYIIGIYLSLSWDNGNTLLFDQNLVMRLEWPHQETGLSNGRQCTTPTTCPPALLAAQIKSK